MKIARKNKYLIKSKTINSYDFSLNIQSGTKWTDFDIWDLDYSTLYKIWYSPLAYEFSFNYYDIYGLF